MNMFLGVIGMFVLVWIISAVMKASTPPQQANQRPNPNNRQRPNEQPSPEKTTNTDLERFMAEIDRLRTRTETPKTQQQPQPQPQNQQRSANPPRPEPTRQRTERRPNNNRRTAAPPPVPPRTQSVPVLQPVEPAPSPSSVITTSTTPGGISQQTSVGTLKQAKLARTAAGGGGTEREETTAVVDTVLSILKSKQAPAVAVMLSEIFGEPMCKRRRSI